MKSLAEICKVIDTEFKGKAVYRDPEWGPTCSYKTNDGKKCFIGLFIPDGHPGQKIEGNASKLICEYPDLLAHMPTNDSNLLDNMQRVHDSLNPNDDVEYQKQVLKDYCAKHFK